MRKAWQTGNFTLIELLVVIAIIAILAGMLLPTLNTARENAYKIRCVGDLKTVGNACMLYAGDRRDTLPARQPSNGIFWYNMIVPDYINAKSASKVFLDMPPAKKRVFNYINMAYGLSAYNNNTIEIGVGACYPRVVRLSAIRFSSSQIYIGDSVTPSDYTFPSASNGYAIYGWQTLHYRHPGGTANIFFADGHVGALNPKTANDDSKWKYLWENKF